MVVEFPKSRGRDSSFSKSKEMGLNPLNLSWRGGDSDNALTRGKEMLNLSWRGGDPDYNNALSRGKEMLNLSWRGDDNNSSKLNLGGMFRKSPNNQEAAAAQTTTSRRDQYRCTKKQQRSTHDHSRRFEDAVDWKNTSIDWGDDNGNGEVADYEDSERSTFRDNNNNNNNNSESSYKTMFRPEKIHPRAYGGRRRSSTGRAADPHHEDSQSTAELTDSNCSDLNASALGLSITSLLSIRKSDP